MTIWGEKLLGKLAITSHARESENKYETLCSRMGSSEKGFMSAELFVDECPKILCHVMITKECIETSRSDNAISGGVETITGLFCTDVTARQDKVQGVSGHRLRGSLSNYDKSGLRFVQRWMKDVRQKCKAHFLWYLSSCHIDFSLWLATLDSSFGYLTDRKNWLQRALRMLRCWCQFLFVMYRRTTKN